MSTAKGPDGGPRLGGIDAPRASRADAPVFARARSGASHVRLPAGVCDLLPPEARALRDRAEILASIFERHGYDRVVTPLFEFQDVVTRGLGAAAKESVFRIVDPASGEIVVLRPDFTAQIARLVAAHLGERPRPLRLYYEGRVARAADPTGRGLASRELFQTGIELVGVGQPWADLEVISVGLQGFEALGQRLTLDLSHAGIVDSLVAGAPNPVAARQALAVKDADRLRTTAPALLPLVDLYGERDVLDRARRELRAESRTVHQALDDLESLADMLQARHHVALTFDLGEQRNLGYYSGLFFHGYVDGAADAVLVGGRYDHLLEEFGAAEPAIGLAIDLGMLRSSPKVEHGSRSGVVIAEADPRRPELWAEAERLRAQGERTAVVAAEDAWRYAEVNGYRVIHRVGPGNVLQEILVSNAGDEP